MIKKIDTNLVSTLATSKGKYISCILFVDNFKSSLNKFRASNICSSKNIEAEFPFINAVSVRVEREHFCELVRHDSVKYVSSKVNVSTLMNIARKVLKIPRKTSGAISIAYIDTGITPHLDFMLRKKRIVKFIDFVGCKLFPYDDNGHGTFVAGVGSGSGLMSCGRFRGVAPNSQIIAIKALNKDGEADSDRILSAMQWIYDNNKRYDIKVVCMSFGSEPLGYNDPIMKGAETLWDIGITVVAAAGNSGPGYQTIKSPGVSKKIITVGGFNDNRMDEQNYNENFFEVADFSSRGPALKHFKPDVIAPSVNIHSCSHNGFYTTLSGTSVATPMIAGICALAYEINDRVTPNELKQLLTTYTKAITYNNNIEGYGIPNAENILSILKKNKKQV